MEKKMYFVFRTSYDDRHSIWESLQKGQLRQGWGCPGTQLTENGQPVPDVEWCKRYIETSKTYWKSQADEEEARKRFWILEPMKSMGPGNLIVVPKMPEWDSFVIATVERPYEFDDRPAYQRGELGDDFRHVIPVDKTQLRVVNYGSCPEAQVVSQKMRAYQSAINCVWNQDMKHAIDHLGLRDPQKLGRTLGIDDIFNEIKEEALSKVLEKVRNLPPSQVENLVASCFEKAGYSVERMHDYDGKGGDIDITLTRSLPIISECNDYDIKVHIQVKNKKGRDANDQQGVEQLFIMAGGDKIAAKILISTADEFTETCRKLAEERGVMLLCGSQLAKMLIKYV